MKSLTTIATACLLSASACAFAGNGGQQQEFPTVTCPPASAFHHVLGQSWTIDEAYKADWSIVQTKWNTWSNVTSISPATPLSVRVVDESVYVSVGDKFKSAGGIMAITCGYVFHEGNNNDDYTLSLVVKSNVEATLRNVMGGEGLEFHYQNDLLNVIHNSQGQQPQGQSQQQAPEANWGWVCTSTAANPGKCKISVDELTQPPMAELKPASTPAMAELTPAMAKLTPAKK
jgi:hypothetical protein